MNPNVLFFISLFLLVFMNGYSDAPNSVAAAVGSGALSLSGARRACAISDALGVIAFSLALPMVARTSGSVASFDENVASALCGGMLSAVLWSAAAERLGIPTSEGHAMSASVAGAAWFSGGRIDTAIWMRIFFGFFSSSVAAAVASAVFLRFLRKRRMLNEDKAAKRTQILLCLACAFLHGAQDGQKFCGLLMLGAGFDEPPLIGVICIAAIMMLGSLVCSRRIIGNVSEKTAKPTLLGGISADASSVLIILLFTLLGIPVSTSNVKVCALAGSSEGSLNYLSLFGMVIIWLATFPACFLLGGLLARIII